MPFAPHTPHSATRRFFSLFTVLLFLFSVLWTGVRAATRHPQIEALDLVGEQAALGVGSHPAIQPDFAKYVNLTTLHEDELRTRGGRVIFVGDIHGMHKSFKKLLKKLKFDSEHDVLVHTGDIILKGPQSRKVIQELMQIKAFGVRGNQDQKVIEWRGWIEWVLSQDGGKKWIRKMEKRIEDKDLSKSDFKHFRKAAAARGWDIPDGWNFGDDIYRLSRKLKADEYQYLLDLPVALHIPSLHTITVHAGILPMDPRHKVLSHHQPLSHPPKAPKSNKTEPVLRNLQELSLFRDIPQNTDPWVKLNMRSILDNGEVTRDNSGTPWSKLWHKVIDLCGGFDVKPAQTSINATAEFNSDRGWGQWMEDEFKGAHSLPCRDVTVVYGHAAARGLDIKRWSKGLDTGCVYNLRLTGLVLGKKWKPTVDNSTLVDSEIELYDVDEDVEGDVISFGKKGRGKVVQVQCAGGTDRLD